MVKINKNDKIIKAAKAALVGGVNSPVRAFKYVGRDPVPIKRGAGSKVYDYNGKPYIDYVLSYGALILGHAHPGVINGVNKTIKSGLGFGATHDLEVQLAQAIRNAIPLLKRIRFTTSGTEAVMGAVRLARGITGRDKILKFEHSYHGHADYLLAKAGSGLITMGLPASKGVPQDFTRHTLIARYGDKKGIEGIFKKHGRNIAAVLVEPVGGNKGVVLPDISFLKKIRSLTRKSGSLLIFDEVITGFRLFYGSAAQVFGITPDMMCLGKIIGGGLPIGAYGGREDIMKHLAPLGSVYQASTFSGNPVVMSAGLATLCALSLKDYDRINNIGLYLGEKLKKTSEDYNTDVEVKQFGPMFSIQFKKKENFKKFYNFLLKEGIYFAPSEYEASFISFAHTNKDIEKTIDAIKKAFIHISRKEKKQ